MRVAIVNSERCLLRWCSDVTIFNLVSCFNVKSQRISLFIYLPPSNRGSRFVQGWRRHE